MTYLVHSLDSVAFDALVTLALGYPLLMNNRDMMGVSLEWKAVPSLVALGTVGSVHFLSLNVDYSHAHGHPWVQLGYLQTVDPMTFSHLTAHLLPKNFAA